jgi:hypothetical protein
MDNRVEMLRESAAIVCNLCAGGNKPEPHSRYGYFHHTSPRKRSIGGKCYAAELIRRIEELENEAKERG